MKALYPEDCRCRLCGRKEQCVNLKNIFDDCAELEIEIKIAKLLPVVVMPWDPLPHDICKACVEKLNLFNEFYDGAIKTDRFLRTFFPSASQNEEENFDPMITIYDCVKSLKNYLETAKYRCPEPPRSPSPVNSVVEEEKNDAVEKPLSPVRSPKTLDDFIINHITSSDSIFTCRECYRTFTKQTSALSHSCMTIENCRDFELAEVSEEEPPTEKALPPLKIRLITTCSGKFVCYLCQTSFDDRLQVVDHLKSHFINGRGKIKYRTKKRRKRIMTKKSLGLERNKSKSPSVIDSNCSMVENSAPIENGRNDGSDKSVINSTKDDNLYSSKTNASNKNTNAERENNHQKASNSMNEYLFNTSALKDCKAKDGGKEKGESGRKGRFKRAVLFSCVFCDKIYTRKDFLRQHQKRHLGSARDTIRFLYCEEENDIEENEDHKQTGGKIKSKEGVHVCEVCNMVFTKKKTLRAHQNYHYVDLSDLKQE